jgi:hypothetical protein
MINVLSFFRKKRNIYFLILITILSIFNNVIINKYIEVDKKIIDNNNEIFLIVDSKVEKEIRENNKKIEINEMRKEKLKTYGIEIKKNTRYYSVSFNRISLYEKYKDKAILLVANNAYNNTLNNLSFYSGISKLLIVISFAILIIIIITAIYYEKETIFLLKMVGYNQFKIFLIYFLNFAILLIPSVIVYIINIIYLIL